MKFVHGKEEERVVVKWDVDQSFNVVSHLQEEKFVIQKQKLVDVSKKELEDVQDVLFQKQDGLVKNYVQEKEFKFADLQNMVKMDVDKDAVPTDFVEEEDTDSDANGAVVLENKLLELNVQSKKMENLTKDNVVLTDVSVNAEHVHMLVKDVDGLVKELEFMQVENVIELLLQTTHIKHVVVF